MSKAAEKTIDDFWQDQEDSLFVIIKSPARAELEAVYKGDRAQIKCFLSSAFGARNRWAVYKEKDRISVLRTVSQDYGERGVMYIDDHDSNAEITPLPTDPVKDRQELLDRLEARNK